MTKLTSLKLKNIMLFIVFIFSICTLGNFNNTAYMIKPVFCNWNVVY